MKLPSGTVTFLFTDIEDSTPLLERLGTDGYERVLAEHHRIIRAAIGAHSGVEVDTAGDGFFVAFSRATDAVCAATDAQAALGAHAWPDGVTVDVRMGVHSGDVRVVDDDYVGLPVHEAARVSAAAHGGQVLVSQATNDLLDHAGLCGGELVDLGPHRLKGVARPLRLLRLVHPQLPDDSRPPRTPRPAQHNLPAATTSFVGRERELLEITHTLDDARIVTLTGVGGVGKTRLAVAAATEMLPSYPDGVWLVELAGIGDASDVCRAVVTAAGIDRQRGMTIEESLFDALREKALLLVLDNCEHLLEPIAGLAEEITQSCPDVSLLATSREGLACTGERVLTVPSLQTPGHDATLEIERFPSVALFVDRARAVRSGFALTHENVSAVAEICRRLNGIPLALELAAARMRSMRASDVAARLGEVFRLLAGGRRTAVERHRTLRATIDWSYELLSETESLVFDRLSVFAGGFTLDAATAVCSAPPVRPEDAEEIVHSLVEKSMVLCDTTQETLRYSLLEPLRQYGAERLDESGDADAARRRHAHHFLEFSETADAGLRGPDEAHWVERLQIELDNLRAAFTWAAGSADGIDIAVRICAPLAPLTGNRWSEVMVWSEELVDHPVAADHPLYSRLLSMVGTGRWQLGDFIGTAEVARRAADVAPDPLSLLIARGVQGSAAIFQGKHAEATEFLFDAIRLLDDVHDAYETSATLGGAALTLSYNGEHERALTFADESLRLSKQLDNPTAQADALYSMAEVVMHTAPDAAIEFARQAGALARSVHNRFLDGVALVTVSSLLGRHGDQVEALEAFSEVVERWREMGNWTQQWNTIRNVIELFARIGRDDAAVVLYGAAEASEKAPPVYGPHGERFNEVVRFIESRMGSIAFAALRSRGAAMAGPDAIAYAQAEIEAALRLLGRPAAALETT